jgi:diguanylate cyclase (GGDEF)-like protein/PAS domain S-box-containing protein
MLLRSIRSRLLVLVLATVVPFLALVGAALWSQWREDETAAIEGALNESKLFAAQLDDHISDLENLLVGLSRAVSTNPADTATNSALLKQIKAKLPAFIANIRVFSLDGSNIGTSAYPEVVRSYAGDREFFKQILAGRRSSFVEIIRTHGAEAWVLAIGYPIEDQEGRLQGVMAVGTQLKLIQDALRLQALPAGSIVRIVDQRGMVVAESQNGPDWIGRDLSGWDHVARHMAAKEASEIELWPDHIRRITGSSTAHQAPWLVSVGLPMDVAFATLTSRLRWGAALGTSALLAAFVIAWMFSGRIVRPLRQLEKDASMLAAGALSHRSAVRTRDEVGNLADTFNRMATSLERRQHEVQQSNDTLSAVIDASPVAIVCSDMERRIMLWSRAAEQLYGYTPEQTLGTPIKIVPPDGRAESRALYERARNGESIRDVDVTRRRKDGSIVDVRLAAAPMYHPDGTVRGVAWAHEDITDRKRAEEQLKRLAHYDPLTGLPNRLSLRKALERLLLSAAPATPTSIALFDLDGFKDVNDTLGHSIGDQLLIEVGQRLIESTKRHGEQDQVFRLGGDEFVVIIPGCGDPRVVGGLVDTMLKRLAEPFRISEQALHLGGSAGVAIAPNDGANVDDLIANADLALYQAKSDGGRTYRLFMPILRAQAQARRGLDLELRRAFAEDELELYFQPEIRLADRAVVGAEALLRWRHPQRGIVAPAAFIDTLADSSIAPEVGRWIIRAACAQAAAWRAMGLPLGRIGVNLFPTQLQGEALIRDIDDALRESGLPAQVLELEITENVALNYEDAITPLQQLSDRGVKLAFDDFGTGYASLSYLTRFPLARIKIDRSFICNITDNAEHAAIVRSLIAMAHNLGLEVIAEGVETEAQAAFLLAENCEEAQGFLYAKPLPAAEFEDYLRTRRLAWESVEAHGARPAAEPAIQRSVAQSSRRRRFPKV